MALERTFCILKPGVLERRLVGEILNRIERKGLVIRALKLARPPRSLWEAQYAEHVGKEFYAPLLEYMSSGPVLLMVLEGEAAIKMLRNLAGPTVAADASPGTIRGDYACFTRKNIIHASDSVESAKREAALFFKDEEILEYPDVFASFLY